MSGKPELLKKINLNLIYKALIDLKTATRQEISDGTHISLTTIRTLLDELLDKEQIVEVQLDESSGGRRAQRYALNTSKNLILSFFIRENVLTYQVMSLTREIQDSGRQEVEGNTLSEFAVKFVDECCSKWSIIAIGIGANGMVKNGDIYTGCSLDDVAVNSVGNLIKEAYNIPVIIENDLNAVAYGYAARELLKDDDIDCANKNIAYIEFREESVSAGIVASGNILRGNNQFSGELSFMPLEKGKTLDSLVASAASNEEATDIVSRVLAVVNCVINPNEIIIGGKFFNKHNVALNQIEESLNKYLAKSVCPKLIFASSFEKDYMLGISRLALFNILELLG